MEITDLISKRKIEAFEQFMKAIEIANKKTINIVISDIGKDLESNYFYLESSQKNEVFNIEVNRVKDAIKKESTRIINEYFKEFVLKDNESRRVGTILDDCTNIHTKNDLKIVDKRMNPYGRII